MRTAIFIFTLAFMCLTTYGQRKKVVKKVASSSNIVAKLGKVSAEVYKNNFYVTNLKALSAIEKDTISLKSFAERQFPLNTKIITITPKSNQFYVISWTENEISTSKLKTEDATTTFTEICDFTTKTKVLSNFQKTTKIKEIRFLDVNQTVSETIDKVRKEGNELKILPEGDVVLSNKKGDTKMTYSPIEKKYIPSK